jgi:hypothetical protein
MTAPFQRTIERAVSRSGALGPGADAIRAPSFTGRCNTPAASSRCASDDNRGEGGRFVWGNPGCYEDWLELVGRAAEINETNGDATDRCRGRAASACCSTLVHTDLLRDDRPEDAHH